MGFNTPGQNINGANQNTALLVAQLAAAISNKAEMSAMNLQNNSYNFSNNGDQNPNVSHSSNNNDNQNAEDDAYDPHI